MGDMGDVGVDGDMGVMGDRGEQVKKNIDVESRPVIWSSYTFRV